MRTVISSSINSGYISSLYTWFFRLPNAAAVSSTELETSITYSLFRVESFCSALLHMIPMEWTEASMWQRCIFMGNMLRLLYSRLASPFNDFDWFKCIFSSRRRSVLHVTSEICRCWFISVGSMLDVCVRFCACVWYVSYVDQNANSLRSRVWCSTHKHQWNACYVTQIQAQFYL